ncbi:alpha-1,3-mannosyl-glycoprotein 4-beta-N-acetylglucosaminyltransferase A isoform X2 [Halichoeres trimaculatus]
MRLSSVRFGCLLALVCFVSLSWIKSVPQHEGPTPRLDLQTLYERLMLAEQLGGQVRKELSNMLDELRNLSRTMNNTNSIPAATETTKDDFFKQAILQPNIFVYMPHLREHPESLTANVVLGQGRRGVSMVMGIPTVRREKQSYLLSTLSSLLGGLTPAQRRDILIIVFIAETDSDYVSRVADIISENFAREVRSGLLEVISPSKYYYPNFTNLKETFGDSKDRVKWRTKQNLDFSFLMLYAQDKGTYYVQLEDDVIAKTDYLSAMKTFTMQEASKEWLYLEFSQLGFIGKMFRTRDLPMIAEFFLMFQRDKPIDWLLDHILWVKVCSPERDAKDCEEQKASLRQRYKPSLFQHVGLHSSLSGKLQRLKDKDFGTIALFRAHRNPPAELSTSLIHYQRHSLKRAYGGEDFFWATTPVRNDYILFNFSQPLNISRYLFHSGSSEYPGDKFLNTTVEVLPYYARAHDRPENSSASSHQLSDNGFIVLG